MNDKLNLLKSYIPKLEKHINIQKGRRSSLQEKKQIIIDEINKIRKESDFIMKEKEFIKEVCTEGRKESKDFLENLVTNSVQYILGEEYSININFNERGATPTAEILLKREKKDGSVVELDPSCEDGGGIADIISMVFRCLYIVITNQDSETPIILDEPTKFVSKGEYAKKAAEFVCEIAEVYNKQIIMVTHDVAQTSIANLAFNVTFDDNGDSQVETIGNK